MVDLYSINNKNKVFSNEKDLLMYFHTSIRNVALTTAVSFAALGYARYYKNKSLLYAAGLTIVSFLIISCSTLLNLYLYSSIQDYFKDNDELSNLRNINIIFIIVHSSLIFFALYTVYRLVFNKKFLDK